MGSDNNAPLGCFHIFPQGDSYIPFSRMEHNSTGEAFDLHYRIRFWEQDGIPCGRRISSLALAEIFLQARTLSSFHHDNFALQLELEPFQLVFRRPFLPYPRNNQMIPYGEWCNI